MPLEGTLITAIFGFLGIAVGAFLNFVINKSNSDRSHTIAQQQTELQERSLEMKEDDNAFAQLERINKRLDDYAAKQDARYDELEKKYIQLRKDYKRDLKTVRDVCKQEMNRFVTEALIMIQEGVDIEIRLHALSRETQKRIDELAEVGADAEIT